MSIDCGEERDKGFFLGSGIGLEEPNRLRTKFTLMPKSGLLTSHPCGYPQT